MSNNIHLILKHMRNLILIFSGGIIIRKHGKRNIISFNKTTRFQNVKIVINGDNNSLTIHDNCSLKGLHISMFGNNNTIEIGNNVSVNASIHQPTIMNVVNGTTITIGDNALFSNNIEIHTSDYHPIYSQNGQRINTDQNIAIGNHVWVGLRTTILKGSEIAEGCVVGANSLVTGKHKKANSIIAGNPAKEIKNNIIWKNKENEFHIQ